LSSQIQKKVKGPGKEEVDKFIQISQILEKNNSFHRIQTFSNNKIHAKKLLLDLMKNLH